MDKASVLGDAIKYFEHLQERVENLDEQAANQTMQSMVLVKKSQIIEEDEESSDEKTGSSEKRMLPKIEARACSNNILLRIQCEKQKGVLVNLLSKLDTLGLVVVGTNVIPFGVSTYDITITAETKAKGGVEPMQGELFMYTHSQLDENRDRSKWVDTRSRDTYLWVDTVGIGKKGTVYGLAELVSRILTLEERLQLSEEERQREKDEHRAILEEERQRDKDERQRDKEEHRAMLEESQRQMMEENRRQMEDFQPVRSVRPVKSVASRLTGSLSGPVLKTLIKVLFNFGKLVNHIEREQLLLFLSAIVPGLNKMDKASVLGDAIKYFEHLQERVENLDEQAANQTMQSTVLVKKTQIIEEDEESSDEKTGSSEKRMLPKIEARACNNNILLRIQCEKQKGVLVNLLSKLDTLGLVVVSSNVIPFGVSTYDITITAEMEEKISLNVKELVTVLIATLQPAA
ncbi:hypothetical protein RD792_016640 [Penstemon davidsonii]|uniref:Uncharacterized protein n=1 Tax=Penstemon davidsonii TaxID=160366 RepID=A0ABR0CKW1_9LAMI|nr:hypothetical protein RD792_016640 [Penstemon davidsonii]